MLEEKKFLSYMEKDKWPEIMDSLRMTLLQSSVLDDKNTEKWENGHSILSSLISALLRVNPDFSKWFEDRNKQQTETTIRHPDSQILEEGDDN